MFDVSNHKLITYTVPLLNTELQDLRIESNKLRVRGILKVLGSDNNPYDITNIKITYDRVKHLNIIIYQDGVSYFFPKIQDFFLSEFNAN
jgi:hypothetical protein